MRGEEEDDETCEEEDRDLVRLEGDGVRLDERERERERE